jgi:hypothetical protein
MEAFHLRIVTQRGKEGDLNCMRMVSAITIRVLVCYQDQRSELNAEASPDACFVVYIFHVSSAVCMTLS